MSFLWLDDEAPPKRMVLGVKDRIMQSSPDKEPQHTHRLFASCPLVSDTHTPLYIHTETQTHIHTPVFIHTKAHKHTHTSKNSPKGLVKSATGIPQMAQKRNLYQHFIKKLYNYVIPVQKTQMIVSHLCCTNMIALGPSGAFLCITRPRRQ